jgi:glycosyltransferase involved in cell wall biosynthesis
MNSNDNIDITVIIPSYNQSRALWEAMDSCLLQKDLSLEILVIDDASTDDTPQMLQNIKSPAVKSILLKKNHHSGGYARNIGIHNARGKYIKLLDHDDILEPGTLLKEYRAAVEHNADMVMSSWGIIDKKKLAINTHKRIYEPPQPEQVIEAIMGLHICPYTSAVLYRREYITGLKWDPNTVPIDDFDWFCRTALKGGKFITIKNLSYWWRITENSISRIHLDKPFNFLKLAYVKDQIYGKVEQILFERGQLNDKYKNLLAQQYYRGLRAFGRFDFLKFRQVFKHIFELSPGFQPTANSEYNPIIRFTIHILGIRSTLLLYILIRRCIDIVCRFFHDRFFIPLRHFNGRRLKT